MADHVKTWAVEVNGTKRTYSKTYTSNQLQTIDGETVADAQTDQQYTIAIDVSAVKSFYLVAVGGALTVETNSGSTPADTLTLVDGRPYEWDTDSEDSFLLGTDVTALFFTNASGATVTVYMECLSDGSP